MRFTATLLKLTAVPVLRVLGDDSFLLLLIWVLALWPLDLAATVLLVVVLPFALALDAIAPLLAPLHGRWKARGWRIVADDEDVWAVHDGRKMALKLLPFGSADAEEHLWSSPSGEFRLPWLDRLYDQHRDETRARTLRVRQEEAYDSVIRRAGAAEPGALSLVGDQPDAEVG